MRYTLILATLTILLLSSVPAMANSAERKAVCKSFITSLDFLEAYSCYKDLGDDLYRDAINALVMGDKGRSASLAKEALPIQSGFGLCYRYDMCGGAAHTAALLSYLDTKTGGTGEEWAGKSVSLAKDSGQCSGGGSSEEDEKARSLCAIMYYLSAMKSLENAHGFFSDEVCKRLSGTGDTRNLDILYIPHGFGNMTEFRKYVEPASQSLLGFKPFNSLTSKINIWMLDEPKDLACQTLEPRMFQCDDAKIAAARVRCPNDQVIIVVKSNQWRGFGQVGGSISGVSSWSDMPYTVVTHELGHALGLNDEYLYGAGDNVAVSANSPNCDSNSTCAKFAGTPGAGCFQGCQSNAMYRSTNSGMMRTLGPPLGDFDEAYLSSVIGRYGK